MSVDQTREVLEWQQPASEAVAACMKWIQNTSCHNSQMERSRLKPPIGFTDFHDNIIQLYCQVNPDPEDLRLSDLLNQVCLFGGDRLAFPIGDIRVYSNNRKQNCKQKGQPSPSRTRVFVADDFYPFFAPSELIDYLLSSQSLPSATSTMSRTTRRTSRRSENYDDDDDDYDGDDRGNSIPRPRRSGRYAEDVDTDDLADRMDDVSLKPRRSARSSRTPPRPKRGTGTTTRGATKSGDSDPLVTNSRHLAFTPSHWPNPFNIQLFLGADMKEDGGGFWAESLFISVPFVAAEDVSRTTLALDMENGVGFDGTGASALLLTCPIIPTTVIKAAPYQIETTFEDISIYHDGSGSKVSVDELETACNNTIKNCKEAYASIIDEETKLVETRTYRLKLPLHPVTGNQIFVHNEFWQNEDWRAKHNGTANLKPNATLVPIKQTSDFASTPYDQMINALNYRVAIFGNERKDFDHVTTPNTTPKKPRDKLQAAKDAMAHAASAKRRSGTTTGTGTGSGTTPYVDDEDEG